MRQTEDIEIHIRDTIKLIHENMTKFKRASTMESMLVIAKLLFNLMSKVPQPQKDDYVKLYTDCLITMALYLDKLSTPGKEIFYQAIKGLIKVILSDMVPGAREKLEEESKGEGKRDKQLNSTQSSDHQR